MTDFITYAPALAMLFVLAFGFVSMTVFGVSQTLVMPLVACAFLLLQGTAAPGTLKEGLAEFASIAVIFTAIGIPAHQIQRSGFFDLVGHKIGAATGGAIAGNARAKIVLITCIVMYATWFFAATLHNVTSMLIWAPLAMALCSQYRVPSHYILCGSLVASNLGGFSTAWGDSPNLIEAEIWGLSHADFFTEIAPLNFIVLTLLTMVVATLTLSVHIKKTRKLSSLGAAATFDAFDDLQSSVDSRVAAANIKLDWRLLIVGFVTIAGFLTAQFIDRHIEIAAAGVAIIFAVAFDRSEHRLHTLQSLGGEVYLTLASVFVIANAIAHSMIGTWLYSLIESTGGSIWAIAFASYLGTGLTEAASWAAVAAPITHAVNDTHAAAWALGAGICAGSSSILTAASAGIILWTQTRKQPEHAITFRSYVLFGLITSTLMLVFYVLALGAMENMGMIT
jgi:Na+/H+ antiporter NhaD/arsenite permease-like protein